MTTRAEVEGWADGLDAVLERIAPALVSMAPSTPAALPARPRAQTAALHVTLA